LIIVARAFVPEPSILIVVRAFVSEPSILIVARAFVPEPSILSLGLFYFFTTVTSTLITVHPIHP
jgi:hypothetical protein